MFKVKIITATPKAFPSILNCSILSNAIAKGLWSLEIISLYDFSIGKTKKQIDDTQFGGGPGMVILPEVASKALDHAINGERTYKIICTSTSGKKYTQKTTKELLCFETLIILCGKFEGIDQRVIQFYNIEEFCIGDFILTSGDTAAIAITESCVRTIPGVLGNSNSIKHESFSDEHNITFHKYTKPRIWNGIAVPDVLLSGNHTEIKKWRSINSEQNKKSNRSDLIKKNNNKEKYINPDY